MAGIRVFTGCTILDSGLVMMSLLILVKLNNLSTMVGGILYVFRHHKVIHPGCVASSLG